MSDGGVLAEYPRQNVNRSVRGSRVWFLRKLATFQDKSVIKDVDGKVLSERRAGANSTAL